MTMRKHVNDVEDENANLIPFLIGQLLCVNHGSLPGLPGSKVAHGY